jgi:isopentenyl phosphate kinase
VKELVFLKLGGSLLTDKTRPMTLRPEVLKRLAAEIAAAFSRSGQPQIGLLIGHGSGSFGHMAASRYRIREGIAPADLSRWHGFAETCRVAAELHRLVVGALGEAGVPILPVQPSASARCRDGELLGMDERPLRTALAQELVPAVYGDVALDDTRGATIISTEQIFRWLAPRLGAQRVVLVGEVAGVLTADPRNDATGTLIEEITPAALPDLIGPGIDAKGPLGGSRGMDVTGGMLAKVSEMVALVQAMPSLSVQIISGMVPGLVQTVLTDPQARAGTRIRAG